MGGMKNQKRGPKPPYGYLYGVDWKEKLKVVDSEEQHNNEESNSANDNDEKAMRQILLEEMIMIHFDLNP